MTKKNQHLRNVTKYVQTVRLRKIEAGFSLINLYKNSMGLILMTSKNTKTLKTIYSATKYEHLIHGKKFVCTVPALQFLCPYQSFSLSLFLSLSWETDSNLHLEIRKTQYITIWSDVPKIKNYTQQNPTFKQYKLIF